MHIRYTLFTSAASIIIVFDIEYRCTDITFCTMSVASSKISSFNESVGESSVTSRINSDAYSLRKAFRSFASSLIVAARQAEKVAAASEKTNNKSSPDNNNNNKGKETTTGDVKEAKTESDINTPLQTSVETILKQRQTVRSTATLLEGRLRGNVKESEALHCCLKSQPCVVGGRKRKFKSLDKNTSS